MIDKLLTLELKWYTDPGHGWLRVPLQTVIDVGVAERISSCSYLTLGRRVAYLEEDCDAPAFLAAAGISFETAAEFPTTHRDGLSFIRRLPTFASSNVRAYIMAKANDSIARSRDGETEEGQACCTCIECPCTFGRSAFCNCTCHDEEADEYGRLSTPGEKVGQA